MRFAPLLLLAAAAFASSDNPNSLPAHYFQLMEQGLARVDQRLAAESSPTLATLESPEGWKHFPSAMLAAAVLYTKRHSDNKHHGDHKMLALALKIGDLCAREQEAGTYDTRLDHDRDTYMWLETYRLLDRELGDERRERWRRLLIALITEIAADTAKRQDYPLYQSPFIGTSPNHMSVWAGTVYIAGKVFGNQEWQRLAAKVLHRFAAEEQSPDGYWGEHSSAGPTTGYDYLTSAAVAEYYEHSHDPAAFEALHRSTEFHEYFTYLDGMPVETINDRNRYWEIPVWGHFGFSNFADGRRYARFLTDHYEHFSLESLGRIAQDALYYHEGRELPIPQDRPHYAHRMSAPAGIRKSGPWVFCLSGIIATQAPTSQFYLDRQSNLSVFREGSGLIITGANSKRQPELAMIAEEIGGQTYFMPMSSRLDMNDREDRLALSYNTFFTVLSVPPPTDQRLAFSVAVTPRGRMAQAHLTFQLVLHPGEALEAAGRTVTLDDQPLSLDVSDSISHHGWTLHLDQPAHLTWPVRPFNPYSNAPEKGINHAVGALVTELEGKPQVLRFAVE